MLSIESWGKLAGGTPQLEDCLGQRVASNCIVHHYLCVFFYHYYYYYYYYYYYSLPFLSYQTVSVTAHKFYFFFFPQFSPPCHWGWGEWANSCVVFKCLVGYTKTKGMKKKQLDSFQRGKVEGGEVTGMSCNTANSQLDTRKIFSPWGWSDTGTRGQGGCGQSIHGNIQTWLSKALILLWAGESGETTSRGLPCPLSSDSVQTADPSVKPPWKSCWVVLGSCR